MHRCIWAILLLLSITETQAYQAEIEAQIVRFTVLNKDTIAEGKPCDTRHADGSYNPCDFVFYMEDCRRYFSQVFDCKLAVNRFYAKENTDDVQFLPNQTRPAMIMNIQDEFPRTLLLNITVWDQDDGFSMDDFIGTYRMYFTPAMLSRNRLGRAGAETVQNVITIPEHSQLTLQYVAYCTDDDCRRQVPGFNSPQGQAGQQRAFFDEPQNFQNLQNFRN